MGESGANGLLGDLHNAVVLHVVTCKSKGDYRYRTIRDFVRQAVRKQLAADGIKIQ